MVISRETITQDREERLASRDTEAHYTYIGTIRDHVVTYYGVAYAPDGSRHVIMIASFDLLAPEIREKVLRLKDFTNARPRIDYPIIPPIAPNQEETVFTGKELRQQRLAKERARVRGSLRIIKD